ncbi:MAG: PqqD family protein [Chloroflexi bacterium]|nr:PqqD family protein [Chloroflexota bacterium]
MIVIDTETRIVPQSDVIATALHNGEQVLLNLATMRYYTLNQTGTQIWQLLADGLSVADVSHRLQAAYDIEGIQAEECVLRLIDELAIEQLVQVGGQ